MTETIRIRRASDRGVADFGWLDSRHTFSFGGYHDPAHMGFGTLRVINEDRVAPGGGFDTHGHRDMEIISYVLDGALEHRDSMGNGSTIQPGDVQRMTAGTGVMHSEFNHSRADPVHFLQIWILPERAGLEPSYEQTSFAGALAEPGFLLVASPDGRDGSVVVHQDARLWIARAGAGEGLDHELEPGRRAWLQVARGNVELNGTELSQGDGAAIDGETSLRVDALEDAEVLLFDLA